MWQTLTNVLGEAWQHFTHQVMDVLPNLLASFLMLAIGILLAVAAGRVAVWLFTAAQVDRGAARLGVAAMLERVGIPSAARFLARLLRWGIILLAFIPALYSLDTVLAAGLVNRFLLYLPNLLVAVALLLVGVALSRFFARSVLIAAVNSEMRAARFLSGATRVAIVLVAAAVALEQLGIGRVTVQLAFTILFGGIMLAAALAVGLGSQVVVRQWLTRYLERDETRKDDTGIRHW